MDISFAYAYSLMIIEHKPEAERLRDNRSHVSNAHNLSRLLDRVGKYLGDECPIQSSQTAYLST